MTRFVIEPEIALRLAAQGARIASRHRLLAPTLLRSQVLAQLFAEVGRGELERKEADRQLDHLRRLRIRLLGDRVLQRVAWDIALETGQPDTFMAEYIALTRLQADALVTHNEALARAASGRVAVVTLDCLLD